jgi:hypothetical protein
VGGLCTLAACARRAVRTLEREDGSLGSASPGGRAHAHGAPLVGGCCDARDGERGLAPTFLFCAARSCARAAPDRRHRPRPPSARLKDRTTSTVRGARHAPARRATRTPRAHVHQPPPPSVPHSLQSAPASHTRAAPFSRAQAVDDDHHLCLAYPLLAGGSLWDALVCRNGETPLTAAQRVGVALCAARGLAALHAARQVHHDVKSGNVLLGAGGDVAVLADTGASYSLQPGQMLLRETPPADNHNYPCWCAHTPTQARTHARTRVIISRRTRARGIRVHTRVRMHTAPCEP